MVNDIKFGPSSFKFKEANLTTWSNHWLKDRGITNGHPRIQFNGFNITGNNNWPRYQLQDIWTLRDDLTLSYEAGGRHDLKMGGEVLCAGMTSNNCARCMGNIVARGAPAGLPNRPTVEQLTAWFPEAYNVDTWNLNALNPWIQRYVIGIADTFPIRHHAPEVRRVAAGRLGRHRPSDPEPGPALRLHQERDEPGAGRRAVDGGRPSPGQRQHPAAPRVRVPAQ